MSCGSLIYSRTYLVSLLLEQRIEVGDTGRCCSGSGLADGQGDLQTRRHVIWEVLSFPIRPHFCPEAELYSIWHSTFATLVQVCG